MSMNIKNWLEKGLQYISVLDVGVELIASSKPDSEYRFKYVSNIYSYIERRNQFATNDIKDEMKELKNFLLNYEIKVYDDKIKLREKLKKWLWYNVGYTDYICCYYYFVFCVWVFKD